MDELTKGLDFLPVPQVESKESQTAYPELLVEIWDQLHTELKTNGFLQKLRELRETYSQRLLSYWVERTNKCVRLADEKKDEVARHDKTILGSKLRTFHVKVRIGEEDYNLRITRERRGGAMTSTEEARLSIGRKHSLGEDNVSYKASYTDYALGVPRQVRPLSMEIHSEVKDPNNPEANFYYTFLIREGKIMEVTKKQRFPAGKKPYSAVYFVEEINFPEPEE